MILGLKDCPVKASEGGGRVHVMHVRLTPEILKQLQTSQGANISVEFSTENHIRIGDSIHNFTSTPEASAIEIYQRQQDCLVFTGAVSHKLTMRRELGQSVSEKLKSRQAQETAARQGRSVQTLELGRPEPKYINSQLGGVTKSGKPMAGRTTSVNSIRNSSPARKSPFLQPRKSPLLVATTPKGSTVSNKTRLLQILAISAASLSELVTRLRMPPETIQPLLNELARRTGAEWALQDESYQAVKVWDWKHYTSAERSAVISRAAEAFDRLSLPHQHPARIRLIHPDKRKGSDRADTSPLSLNPPVTGPEEENRTEEAMVVPSQPNSPPNAVDASTATVVKRNGLLSKGKPTKSTSNKTKEKDLKVIEEAPTEFVTKSTRTSSLTSNSSTKSQASTKSQVSTAPSSISEEPVRTKSVFLSTKNPEERSRIASAKESSPGITSTQPSTTSAPLERKRKAEEEAPHEPIPKRIPTIDLCNMARDYKRLYPEYMQLHDDIARRVEDKALFTKFMNMHNQMSKWKQTLHAEEQKR